MLADRGIDDDARLFREQAEGLLVRLAPDLGDQRIEDAVLQLYARLDKHKEARSRLDELSGQMSRAEEEAREAAVTIQSAEKTLAELCEQAGCSPHEFNGPP